jgi:hypothetical protein
MNKFTTVEVVSDPSLESHVLKIKTPSNTNPFYIPVVVATDGDEQRAVIGQMVKESNKMRGSSYMKPSFTGLFGDSYNERGANKFFPKSK